ncbi:Molybdopterin molybdenumtransferase [Methanoculleus chikugoensis]|jgi:putative molybdopterin biosynthesis protein|uniref:Molybdopterin molybdenumtransferase n=1 Tax=Methanoculleus chikugoensis TaxID=118126 RepID=A0A1M4MKK2_9EURY|nr:molybdopterin-binding protein [Methanoculleus chikugoensis]MDD4567304.1 molybdopterin-binding protein [Methanoculleus chikugoensis]NMA10470.1 molybdopterin molybdenumtransferase MoeA [Methanomicrobiales archaeon]SCL75444.1 Molybdopterin molybdenumtransferase [Methanoculleus chikugoensis]
MVRARFDAKPLAEVRAMMRSAFPCPDRIVTLPVAGAAGRVTAGPVYSSLTIPATEIAARDGFAVVSGETLRAGDASPVPLRNPSRVNTGNAIPPGYDGVVMIEDVIGRDGAWYTKKPVLPGEHIHPAGSEIRRGDLILPAGHRIRPCDIGALLSCGIVTVDVREVKVGLIPTGSELVPAGNLPGPGGAVESNTAVAAALLGEAGATCTRYGIVRDEPVLLRQAITDGIRENDLLLISAGSSAGTRDFTAAVIGDLGKVLVHGIAMKPGAPAIVGRIDGKPVIGVPGYPIAALTAARELALPLLAAWGFSPPPAERLRARLSGTVTANPGYDEFVLLTVSRTGDGYAAIPLPRGAGPQMALVHANAYLHVPAGTGGIGEGTEVEILPTGQCREQDEICKPTPEQPVQDRKETFSVKDGT